MKHLRTFEELNQSTYQKIASKISDKYPGLASKIRKHGDEFGANKPNFTIVGYIGKNKSEIVVYKPTKVNDLSDYHSVMYSRGILKKYVKTDGKWKSTLDELSYPLSIQILNGKIMDENGNTFLPKTRKDVVELEKYMKQWDIDTQLDKRNNATDVWGDWINDLN